MRRRKTGQQYRVLRPCHYREDGGVVRLNVGEIVALPQDAIDSLMQMKAIEIVAPVVYSPATESEE